MAVNQLKTIINDSKNIVFFGGAGVSTESNIPDFRSTDGLYSERSRSVYSPEEILSHTFFVKHTKAFYDFYRSKMIYTGAKPNDAHIALAKLEALGKIRAVITQNIDGLHQMAGSKKVLELHGSVHRNFCTACGKAYGLETIIHSSDIPRCASCSGVIKPDVVLYEEALNDGILDESIEYISNADVLIVGGTSLTVYPAAGLIKYFPGKHLILINKASTSYDHYAELVINDSIGKTLKEIL